jgi:hypothetical protein
VKNHFTFTLLGLGLLLPRPAHTAPVHLVNQFPTQITAVASGLFLVNFEQVAFGNLELTPPPGATNHVMVHFGEDLKDGRINRHPPGSVRYSTTDVSLQNGKPIIAAPPADERNTDQPNDHPPAVLTPLEWGVVTPFRWVEIEGWPGELRRDQIVRRAAFSATWNDQAASFKSSDEMLNRIWNLCRYSIKATTFAGVYVDGDRERIPYEADAYLNQLSQYAVEGDIQMARDTFDRLLKHPTWPTEWSFHLIFMAQADWMQTGDINWLRARYDALKPKLLLDRAGPDGLLVSTDSQMKKDDLVDWPKGERDGFVFRPVNTVINTFYLRALADMAEMARALGKNAEADAYADREHKTQAVFQEKLFNAARGLYRDGEGTDHCSLHANLFPLAFGLVPGKHREHITQWLANRGMACSVYAAQYLLAGLFENNAGREALQLITANDDRSWRHMVESGATITWEAWDQKYKPNLDWTHAWGAAPANLLPRFVLGVHPLAPGWQQALIRPNPGNLKFAQGKVPTPCGPVLVDWQHDPASFSLTLTLPPGMTAHVELPAVADSARVLADGKPIAAEKEGDRWVLAQNVSGTTHLEVKPTQISQRLRQNQN